MIFLLETTVPPDEGSDTLSESERKASAEADDWLKHNKQIPHHDVLAEFGLTMADWEKMAEEPEAAPRGNGYAHRMDRRS